MTGCQYKVVAVHKFPRLCCQKPDGMSAATGAEVVRALRDRGGQAKAE